MANSKLSRISESEQALLYTKLDEYSRGRAPFKEVRTYLVVLPQPEKLDYSSWLYSPPSKKQPVLHIHDLSPDINESLWIVNTTSYYSRRCLIPADYNKKKMQSNGDNPISFGKYRKHFLYEILKVDLIYLGWIAHRFIPKIPRQERSVKVAQTYHSVYLDMVLRKSKEMHRKSRYLGEMNEKPTDLKLKVMRVRLEDDPYKIRIYGTTPQFFVEQILTLNGASGNLATMSIPSKIPSTVSRILFGVKHKYHPGEIIYVTSTRVSCLFESYGSKYTRLSNMKLIVVNAWPGCL